MHPIIRNQLEQVLGESPLAPEHPAVKHLTECEACREEVAAMREHAAMLREWRVDVSRAPVEALEPRAGFYARVLERIELQRPISVFTLFFDSIFGRRIAMASLALALLVGVYVISSEQMSQPEGLSPEVLSVDTVAAMPQDLPGTFSADATPRFVTGTPDQDAVLVNLVTYREQ